MYYRLSLSTLAAVVLLSGCSKLSKENYDQIKMGMDYDEVVKLIGTPDACEETLGIKGCKWKSGDKKVSVSFIGDSVTFFSNENLK